MSLQAIALDERSETQYGDPAEGLIATCFDRAFMVFNLFVDDPRTCLDLSESVFRGLGSTGGVDELTFYGALIEQVRDLPERNECLAGVETDSVLCWLLKDSVDLRYAEIAQVMGLDRGQVAQRIADVRMALLPG